jgi:hypothetical protein
MRCVAGFFLRWAGITVTLIVVMVMVMVVAELSSRNA